MHFSNKGIKEMKKTVRLYACGGAGGNIAQKAIRDLEQRLGQPGWANLITSFFDTSRSDLLKNVPDEQVYIITDNDGNELDGAGQNRAEIHPYVVPVVRSFLQSHQPGDLNLILSTASGGSGSVIAYELANELLARGEKVIFLLVGETRTTKVADNTKKTLASLDNLTARHNIPALVFYMQNSRNLRMEVVDTAIVSTIDYLCILYSGENHGLDSKDLDHWLNFQKNTSYKPQLASLNVINTALESNEGESMDDVNGRILSSLPPVISVATLTNHRDNMYLPIQLDYQPVGVPPQAVYLPEGDFQINYVITCASYFAQIAKDLGDQLKDHGANVAARIENVGSLRTSEGATDTGCVL